MKTEELPISSYFNPNTCFAQLSVRDLLDARDKYHADLMRHPNVIGTAIGRYRIRKTEPWPKKNNHVRHHQSTVRTLNNSEVRPYSWPAILVFVQEWTSEALLAKTPSGPVPKTLYLPDERAVPVCVIEAPKEIQTEIEARNIQYPLNNIGGGNPVLAQVQGREYAATIGCLVSDGHKTFAITNRHVTGDPGEIVFSRLGGRQQRIGVSSDKQLAREVFTKLYPGWPGDDVYINLDVGLIEVDDLNLWTATVGNNGEELGRMVDLSLTNSMPLIGCHVRGFGAASGEMAGEIHALFYRYKTLNGFEYVADMLIGPRSSHDNRTPKNHTAFATHPGDSGSLWVLDPSEKPPGKSIQAPPLPLALQWGRNMLYSAGTARPQSYVLATFLAKVCSELGVDPVRRWNLDQADTWGSIGHFSIANRTPNALSNRFPKLVQLMNKNALIVSHDDATILTGNFTGLGSSAFVPLADVPDFFWKPRISKQGHSRPMEGPNHFADMDQPGPNGKTLLDLCKDTANIDAAKWNAFYNSVKDLLTGDPITAQHRGLLPFRAWQIFDAMADFAKQGNARKFLCAAGVLTHYIGDACQPLHISYLHDGDPLRPYPYTLKKGAHQGETQKRALGNGVHSAYEDEMVSAYTKDILDGLKTTPKATKAEQINNGFEAAQKTIALMRATFTAVPPIDIVNAFIGYNGLPKDRASYMWHKFGNDTISVMKGGVHLLAVLWESAWAAGDGEHSVSSVPTLSQTSAMNICKDPKFLSSLSVDQIGAVLKHPNS